MSGISMSSAALDPRRKRLLFRAWRRGTREMDLVLGHFAEDVLAALDEAGLADFEALLEVPDGDLFAWISGKRDAPSNYDGPLLSALRAFHADGAVINPKFQPKDISPKQDPEG
jgi:antitoxin CptB